MEKWKRRYFLTKKDACAFAASQNTPPKALLHGGGMKEARAEDRFATAEMNSDRSANQNAGAERAHAGAAFPDRRGGDRLGARRDEALLGANPSARAILPLSEIVEPVYRGPQIERYFGDHWSMHLPFAYELMRELAPRVFVELGVWKGESYFTFCQSAAENKVNVKCFGVDSWLGDIHMGQFDPELGREVADYNWRYSSFSELMAKTFIEALQHFPDGAIDLLHIDGAHTYRDVKSDFESWRPKLSPNAVVLFHDVIIRDRGFGVWKLWEDLARPENSFLFEFGYGLGVWKNAPLSNRDAPFLRRLLGAGEAGRRQINNYYANAAGALALWHRLEKRTGTVGPVAPAPVVSPRLEIFSDQGNGYDQACTLSESLLADDTWQTIRIANLERIYTDKSRPLRIDPIDCPSVVTLSSIRIVRTRDKAILYSAESPADFEKIQFSSNLRTGVDGENLVLLVSDADPQIYLPVLTNLPNEPLRAEVTLRVEIAPRGLVTKYARALETKSELEAVVRTTQTQLAEIEAGPGDCAPTLTELRSGGAIGRSEAGTLASRFNVQLQPIAARDTELVSLKETYTEAQVSTHRMASSLEALKNEKFGHQTKIRKFEAKIVALEQETAGLKQEIVIREADNERLSGLLEAKTQENAGHQAHFQLLAKECLSFKAEFEGASAGVDALNDQLRDLQNAAQKRQDEGARLSGISEILKTTVHGLKVFNAHLQRRLADVSGGLRSAAAALEKRDSQTPALVDLVLDDIDRLHSPSVWSKFAQAFGRLSVAPPWILRAASDRRGLASQLVAGLRETLKALSSETTAPEVAAQDIARILELRRRTRQLAHSLRFPNCLKHNRPKPEKAIRDLVRWAERAKNGSARTLPAIPLFDAAWYLGQFADVAASGVDPLEHYLRWGAREGRDPNPLFSTGYYLAQYPDVANADLNPLQHYWEFGAREERDPNPLFSSKWYRTNNPKAATMNPLQHYLEEGAREGRDPHPVFNTAWYLAENPEVAGLNPLEHYLRWGAQHGRSPQPLFETAWYRDRYCAADKKADLLQHYLTIGWKLGYWPNAQFDPSFYLRANPDVAEARLEPFSHYVRTGKAENRATCAPDISVEACRSDLEIPRQSVLPAKPQPPEVKAIAFYLPQFHRIPKNDAWWGEGFTEWANVLRGRPNFEGHYQPHVPSTLGYYDLAQDDVLEKQTRLATAAGLYGFCFYYYWFDGEILLDLPVRRMVETGKPDFPFCICWANENWTRRWDGKDNEVLIAQKHSPEDDLAFIRNLEPIFALKNYIRVDGKPMLLVYRPSLLPDAAATLKRWRQHTRRAWGGELHLVMVRSFSERRSPESYGFDAAVQFPPHLAVTPVTPLISGKHEEFTGFIYDYHEVKRKAVEQFSAAAQKPPLYPGVMPSWDNTARQQRRSTVWVNSSPEAYCQWLAEAARLVRIKNTPADQFVFINAWNEWAEGCHLEPDERFEYAWLNATSLALRDSSPPSRELRDSSPHPRPPVVPRIEVNPLVGPLKVVLSVLLYHREDIIPAFLRALLPQIRTASAKPDLSCELFLSFNYKPTSALLGELQDLASAILPGSDCHMVENGFNLGFGAGHNAIFKQADSDLFIVLNSDLQIQDDGWIKKFVEHFRTSDASIIGLQENASRLREDGCGVPVYEKGAAFDFIDGSVLAIRSDLVSRFGLFSPSFDYFYYEDVDLNLRYRQIGLRTDTLAIACIHERSSSSQLLPAYAVESVLDRNRTRFFERWGKYLTSHSLENRLALRFAQADRQLQCASLPAIFGLLREHPTAILDLWGTHEQLVPLFQHERIRLIPSWQTLREADYLRSYALHHEAQSERPTALELAEQMLVEPDFEQARLHLSSLVVPSTTSENNAPKALLYLARQESLFAGRQPNPRSFLAAEEVLRRKNFRLQCYSEYGTFEVESVTKKQRDNWKYTAWSDGLEFLTDLAQAEVLVTSDGWAAELGQLLDKRMFVWLGATSITSLIWNDRYASSFIDDSLSCLGCHHRFGTIGRNICLRGDIACMRESLADPFAIALDKFLDGHSPPTHRTGQSSANLLSRKPLTRSSQETLAAWPRSSAASVLVLTPVNPNLDKAVLARARMLAERAISGMRGSRIVYDDAGEAPPRGAIFPYRLAAITPLRQAMIERHLRDERWVFWVDADLVQYPANLIDQLIARAEGGIAAPLVLMEGDVAEPAYPTGFGPGRFYDIAGFVEHGRWARFTPPYFDQGGPVYQLDSVGCCYLVNADLYRWGAKHELDPASKRFIAQHCKWPDDAIERNQSGPANSFTDHYTVCEFARQAALPVQAFGDLVALHQRP